MTEGAEDAAQGLGFEDFCRTVSERRDKVGGAARWVLSGRPGGGEAVVLGREELRLEFERWWTEQMRTPRMQAVSEALARGPRV